MGAVTGTYGLVGPQRVSFKITLGSTSDTQTNADILTTSGLATKASGGAPSSLAKFFGTIFASNTAADDAFRALGGEISVRQTGGTAAPAAILVGWQNVNAVPCLQYVAAGGASNEVLEVIISLPHSIIQ